MTWNVVWGLFVIPRLVLIGLLIVTLSRRKLQGILKHPNKTAVNEKIAQQVGLSYNWRLSPCIYVPLMGFSPWSRPFGDSHSTRNSAAPEACTLNSRMRHHDEKSYGSTRHAIQSHSDCMTPCMSHTWRHTIMHCGSARRTHNRTTKQEHLSVYYTDLSILRSITF